MLDGARVDRVASAVRRGREPTWRVPTRRVRRHVAALRAEGWTLERIATAADVALATVHRTLVAARCSNRVERQILAVDSP